MAPLEQLMLKALRAAEQIEFLEMSASEARAQLRDSHRATVESTQVARKNLSDATSKIRDCRHMIRHAISEAEKAK